MSGKKDIMSYKIYSVKDNQLVSNDWNEVCFLIKPDHKTRYSDALNYVLLTRYNCENDLALAKANTALADAEQKLSELVSERGSKKTKSTDEIKAEIIRDTCKDNVQAILDLSKQIEDVKSKILAAYQADTSKLLDDFQWIQAHASLYVQTIGIGHTKSGNLTPSRYELPKINELTLACQHFISKYGMIELSTTDKVSEDCRDAWGNIRTILTEICADLFNGESSEVRKACKVKVTGSTVNYVLSKAFPNWKADIKSGSILMTKSQSRTLQKEMLPIIFAKCGVLKTEIKK